MSRIITTATPQRISLAGGGTDINYFYEKHGGVVLSATIDKFIYVTVKEHHELFQEKYRLNYSITEHENNLDDIKNEIARECIRFLNITESLYISTTSDLPASSGLASSSCFAVGLLNALHCFRGDHVSIAQIAEEACKIEIDVLKKPIGKQDQYAAAFGGANYFNFNSNGKVSIEPIVSKNIETIFSNSILFYTNIQRSADEILSNQKENFNTKEIILLNIKEMASTFYNALSKTDFSLYEIGDLLNKNWLSKRELSTKISNDFIDELYERSLFYGALGGKILGAGGGGFLYLIAKNEHHELIKSKIPELKSVNFRFEPIGTRILINQ
jgi:D-glycero-alpha-D-manno-heptose-7-phosphate kinase